MDPGNTERLQVSPSETSCPPHLCSVSELNTRVSFSWWNAKMWPVSVADQQPRSEVYYHVSHSFSSGALRQLYMPPSVILNVFPSLPPSLRLPVSLPGLRHRGPRRWWVSQMELKCLVPQLSPMQIALSTESITANSQQSVLFDAFFFLFLIMMSWSVALLLLSLMFQTRHFLICLSCLFFVFLPQVYRHSYMASYSIYNIHTRYVFLFSSAVEWKTPVNYTGLWNCTTQTV